MKFKKSSIGIVAFSVALALVVGPVSAQEKRPGASPEQVKAQTGFEIVMPSSVPTTEAPTAEELDKAAT